MTLTFRIGMTLAQDQSLKALTYVHIKYESHRYTK